MPDSVQLKGLIQMSQHTRLAWCVTGLHYGVTVQGEARCPYCERRIAELQRMMHGG